MNLLEKDNFLSDLSAELSKLMEKADEYLTALSTYPDQILWTLDEYPELHSQIEEAFHHSKLYSGEETVIDQLYTASYGLHSKTDYVIFRNLYQEAISTLLSEKVASQENLSMLIDKGQKIFITTVQQVYQHHLNELRGIYETFQQNILAPFFQLNDLMIQGDKLFEFERATIPSGFEVAFETIANDLGKYVEVFEEISTLAKNLPTESDFEENKAEINEEIINYCCFDKFLNELSHPYKEVMELVYVEGKKQGEVSEILGITLANVKIRIKRAKESLKQKLQECCHYEVDKEGNLVGEPNCNCCE